MEMFPHLERSRLPAQVTNDFSKNDDGACSSKECRPTPIEADRAIEASLGSFRVCRMSFSEINSQPKRIKKQLKKLLVEAYENELTIELTKLATRFDEWKGRK